MQLDFLEEKLDWLNRVGDPPCFSGTDFSHFWEAGFEV